MPKFGFVWWEEGKYLIEFEADNLEHAKELMQEAHDIEMDIEVLPNMTQIFRKGDETWDFETLQQIEETE
jgi:hypothetical protein